jgi:hypothetical protein
MLAGAFILISAGGAMLALSTDKYGDCTSGCGVAEVPLVAAGIFFVAGLGLLALWAWSGVQSRKQQSVARRDRRLSEVYLQLGGRD